MPLDRAGTARGRRWLLAAGMVLTLVTAACGDDEPDRPTLTAWTPVWSDVRDLEPAIDEAEAGGTEVCGEFLGKVREQRERLLPAPDPSLDAPTEEWIEEAETVGLDCDREGDLVENLDDLRRRAASIDALIEALRSGSG